MQKPSLAGIPTTGQNKLGWEGLATGSYTVEDSFIEKNPSQYNIAMGLISCVLVAWPTVCHNCWWIKDLHKTQQAQPKEGETEKDNNAPTDYRNHRERS